MSSGEKPIRGVVQSKESANGSGVLFRWALVNDGKHYKCVNHQLQLCTIIDMHNIVAAELALRIQDGLDELRAAGTA